MAHGQRCLPECDNLGGVSVTLTVVKHIKRHEALPADKAFYTNQW